MNEFDNLKRSYVATIQLGMSFHTEYNETKLGNEILHRFCEELVDNSNYGDIDKQNMKHELGILKEMLSKEIDEYYKNT